ncbi:MAG: HAMP domain-containing sensor histidine kinase [Clostridium sp.]|uniref:HAMP domain-containing sensor histidine kinase n=1 Tax=Clostridium sp. TaxID=1506 RepID=UPI00321758EF
MIKKFKIKYNIILGVLIGFILAQFVIAEGYAIITVLQLNNGTSDFDIIPKSVYFFKYLALFVFIVTIGIFCTRRFRTINFNKISLYITLSLIFSIVVTFELLFIILTITVEAFPKITYYLETNYFVSVNLAFIMIIIGIGIFLTTFILLLNRKVKYIKFLTKEVKSIQEDGFGKTINVKGKDELAELCTSINNMSIELAQRIENEKKIENTKAELITNISHDLKTPLTSLVGYLELLDRGEVDEETREKYIYIAYSKSLRLKDLVNELFEYTKLTSPDFKINREKHNLANLINQMVGESILGFSSKNIEVLLKNPYREIYTYIDIKLFSRVIENLIKNAEKYSDEGGIFKIEVNKEGETIFISFTNKCESLKDAALEKIFEKFYRLDEARSLENEGSGLGLSIAKRIIELHEGSLTAEKKGELIEFKIKLNS